jgi:soluble lytic murein transglycosylase-like protein
MPRARPNNHYEWQTAAVDDDASGCFSFYLLPPLAVLLIACLLTVFALNIPVPTSASSTYNSTTPSVLSPIFTREVQHWGDDIIRWANASSLDPNLVAVIMQIESCGDPRALSGAGAMGLFQVMPFHFHFDENPYNPDTNALRGLNYLARSLEKAAGDPRLALAGYNGGIGVITRGEWSWSAQTKRYAYYGAPIYEDARSGATSSPMLDEWYRKYGAGLCRQAGRRLGISNE